MHLVSSTRAQIVYFQDMSEVVNLSWHFYFEWNASTLAELDRSGSWIVVVNCNMHRNLGKRWTGVSDKCSHGEMSSNEGSNCREVFRNWVELATLLKPFAEIFLLGELQQGPSFLLADLRKGALDKLSNLNWSWAAKSAQTAKGKEVSWNGDGLEWASSVKLATLLKPCCEPFYLVSSKRAQVFYFHIWGM